MPATVLRRKNWLFVGSERGGRAAAIAFSLIQTCKLHAVELYADLAARSAPSMRTEASSEKPPPWCQPAMARASACSR